MSKPKILYNVTVHVEDSIVSEWKSWMKEVHIPDVMRTGMFDGFHFSKIISNEQQGGKSFAILYIAKDEDHLNKYQQEFAPALQKEHSDKYGERALAFRTLMEMIDSDL